MSSDAVQQSVSCFESGNQVTSKSSIVIRSIDWSNHVPTELVAHIFSFVVRELGIAERRESPLALCAVCRKWRSISISTPRLWSIPRLSFKRPLDDGYEFVLLQQWLSRAAAVPLFLDLRDQVYLCSEEESHLEIKMKTMADTIASVLPRSSAVYMRLEGDLLVYLDPAAAFSMNIPYTLLEDVHLLITQSYAKMIDLRACPNLRNLVSIYHPHHRFVFGDTQFNALGQVDMAGNMHDIYVCSHTLQLV